jgi:hypothetical protein
MDIKSKEQIYSLKGATGIIYQLADALPSPADRYQTMNVVKEAISALNEISTSDPMKDFWEGVITATAVVEITILLAKITENK